jgi:hypothetical protein
MFSLRSDVNTCRFGESEAFCLGKALPRKHLGDTARIHSVLGGQNMLSLASSAAAPDLDRVLQGQLSGYIRGTH